MKKKIFKRSSGFQIFTLYRILLVIVLLLGNCNCDNSIGPVKTQSNLIVIYPNSGNKLTFVDHNTLEVVNNNTMDIPDSLQVFSMCLSTGNDYLIFSGLIGRPPFSHYIISYNIAQNKVHNIFPTGLDSVGAPRLTAAYLPNESGLIYLYSHNVGLFSINILSQKTKLVASERWIPKEFYHSADKMWIAINKYIPGGTKPGYSEIELYKSASALTHFEFVLNENNQDSIQVDDLTFTSDNTRIFISIRLPQSRYIANYFGSYDLKTKKLYKSQLIFPWSLNPYYLAYSPKRKEVYLVGAQDKFYIVGTDSTDYYLKGVINLTGKIPGPSRILVRPDEKVAFVSCADSNFVVVIDLENRQIIKTIQIESPYLMILLQ